MLLFQCVLWDLAGISAGDRILVRFETFGHVSIERHRAIRSNWSQCPPHSHAIRISWTKSFETLAESRRHMMWTLHFLEIHAEPDYSCDNSGLASTFWWPVVVCPGNWTGFTLSSTHIITAPMTRGTEHLYAFYSLFLSCDSHVQVKSELLELYHDYFYWRWKIHVKRGICQVP